MCRVHAKNVDSIIISSDCQNPVSCFVDPCTVGNCNSNDNASCMANYCGDCLQIIMKIIP